MSIDLVRKNIVSIRRLMVLVAIAAVLCWYVVKILFDVLGYKSV